MRQTNEREIEVFRYTSPFGDIYTAFKGPLLVEVSFLEPPSCATGRQAEAVPPLGNPFKAELDAYFSGKLRAFRQKTAFLFGTPFEHAVWNTLREIPYGATRSYKWVAEKVGRPRAYRAAGHALGKNPLGLVLPCHRVVGSNGSLCGFAGGIASKQWLLDHEAKTSECRPR